MDIISLLQTVAALVFVLGLIWLIAHGMRRWGKFSWMAEQSGQRRLQLVDILPLEGRRRLVLVRRDDREHLLLVGGPQDMVVETSITPPKQSAPSATRKPAAKRTSA